VLIAYFGGAVDILDELLKRYWVLLIPPMHRLIRPRMAGDHMRLAAGRNREPQLSLIRRSRGLVHMFAQKNTIAAAIFVVSSAHLTHAAEGGFSFYLPGTAGDVALAQSPEPGWQVANTVFVQQGDADAAVLQGRVNVGLDLTLVLDVVTATYTFDKEVLGGTYTIGAAVPFGYAELDATVTGPLGGTFSAERDSFNIADIALIPFQMNWSFGNYSLKLAEAVYVPVGAYDVDEVVNLGLNHWGFDTSAAATYFNLKTGTELSVAPGILINTENNATDYRTGNEFHVDFTVNQFLSETFAVGVRGYYYKQLTGDSGSGATLGDFKGESFGVGPGFIWFPEFAAGKMVVLGK
jgi:hypothetical protein